MDGGRQPGSAEPEVGVPARVPGEPEATVFVGHLLALGVQVRPRHEDRGALDRSAVGPHHGPRRWARRGLWGRGRRWGGEHALVPGLDGGDLVDPLNRLVGGMPSPEEVRPPDEGE